MSLDSYPEIRNVLQLLLKNARPILGPEWIGLYIHGSLAYGDFDPQTSDIDFLVVTRTEVSEAAFLRLKEMHRRLFSSGLSWSQKLEGAYLPRTHLRRHEPAQPPIPWLGVDGHFARETLGRDWIIQRWILREKGIAVEGPQIKGMIDPVSPADLKGAVLGSLQEWWSPPFPSPERFLEASYRAYAVLTMCRSLYVVEHGRIASKPEAARWALTAFPEWKPLILEALEGQRSPLTGELKDTFDFIQYTLRKAGLSEKSTT